MQRMVRLVLQDKKKLFLKQTFTDETLEDLLKIDKAYFCYLCFNKLFKKSILQRAELTIYAKVYAMTLLYMPDSIEEFSDAIEKNVDLFEKKWPEFIEYASKNILQHWKRGELPSNTKLSAVKTLWYDSIEFEKDVKNFYFGGNIIDSTVYVPLDLQNDLPEMTGN